MVIGYYKYELKKQIIQFLYQLKLRYQDIGIGRRCMISKKSVFGKGVNIRNNSIIGINVKLGENVIIGSNVSINNISVGKNSAIENGVIFTGFGEGKVKIGDESYIGIYNVLDWSDNITIGNYVHIAGPSTGLWTHSSAKQCHNGLPLSYKGKEYRPTAPIIIGDYVYIGGNCTIYPGVTIGHHAMIAPNSAVTKDVKPYTLVGGVPAVTIKVLDNKKANL